MQLTPGLHVSRKKEIIKLFSLYMKIHTGALSQVLDRSDSREKCVHVHFCVFMYFKCIHFYVFILFFSLKNEDIDPNATHK